MHLGGQLPPEGNEDLGTEEQAVQMSSVILPKTVQSLPLNMSMNVSSSIASTLQSITVSRTSTSPDQKQEENSDKDVYDAPVSQVNPITDRVLEKQGLSSPFISDGTSANSSPLEEDPDNDANSSGVNDYSLRAHKALHNKSQTGSVVSKTKEDDENIPLSLCTRSSSQDSLLSSRDLSEASHLVLREPKSNPQSAALDLSPALTPPSSPSHQPKLELRGTQTTIHVDGKGIEPDVREGGETMPSLVTNGTPEEKSENTLSRDAQGSKRKEGVIKPIEINHGNWVKNEAEVEKTPPDTPAIPSQAARSEKPYSCVHCGKEYASRSGLKVTATCLCLTLQYV